MTNTVETEVPAPDVLTLVVTSADGTARPDVRLQIESVESANRLIRRLAEISDYLAGQQ